MDRPIVPKALIVNDVAEATRFKPKTIRSWLRLGIMRGSKIRGQWRVRPEEVQRFLAEHQVGYETPKA